MLTSGKNRHLYNLDFAIQCCLQIWETEAADLSSFMAGLGSGKGILLYGLCFTSVSLLSSLGMPATARVRWPYSFLKKICSSLQTAFTRESHPVQCLGDYSKHYTVLVTFLKNNAVCYLIISERKSLVILLATLPALPKMYCHIVTSWFLNLRLQFHMRMKIPVLLRESANTQL